MKRYLGIDVGGTKVAAGVVTEDGRVLSHLRAPTAELRAGGDPLSAILALGQRAISESGGHPGEPLAGVGIGLPGPADPQGILMLAAPTLPELLEVSLQPVLEETFGCPAAGENDANACALAEARFGAGVGASVVAYITISTGIGGGVVVDGQVYRGAGGTSGEFGHQIIVPFGGPPCDCGGYGCLEALASGRGIAARARLAYAEAGGDNCPDPDAITSEWLVDRLREVDRVAGRVWRETVIYLGAGISNVINLLDPEVVILGGGVATGAADLLFEPLRRQVAARCMPSLTRPTRIVPAALGPEVGIVGAACLAMDY